MGDGPADREIAAFWRGVAPIAALLANEGPRGHFYRRTLQETSCLLLRGQQRANFALQHIIARACLAQKPRALGRRTLQHRLQQVTAPFPPSRTHPPPRPPVRDRARPWRCSSRASR